MVSGSLRATDTLYSTTAQFQILQAPTTSNGTTYGPGSANNFIKSNGTSIYWTTLETSDIPTISITDKTSGTLTVARGGTGTTSFTANSVIMSGNSTTAALTTRAITNNTSATAVTANTNLITANTLYYHTGNSNITTVGTITSGTWQGTIIAASYIGEHSTDKLTSGTLPVARGGTGITTSTTVNAVLIGNSSTATNAFQTIATASGAFYATAANGKPSFGTLPVAQGGTGQTSVANIKAGKDGDGNTISSTYLKLSGGTMTGGLTLVGNQSSSWNDKGIVFTNGSRIGENTSKALGIYSGSVLYLSPDSATVASGKGLEISSTAVIPIITNAMTLGDSSHKWSNVYATTFTGNLTGDVTGHASSDLALTGGTVTGDIKGNSTAALGTTANPFHNLVLGGTTTTTMTANSTNPRITFQENTGDQPVHLIYTDYDNYRSPAGLKVVGGTNATPAWFEVEGNVYAAGFNGPLTGNVTGNCSGSSGSCTGNAATATKATQDGSGNVITSTYIPLKTSAGIASVEGGGNYSYCTIATINTNEIYINYPIMLELSGRGIPLTVLQIQFISQGTVDPALDYFTSNYSNRFYIKKTATGQWTVYGNYIESWGTLCLHRISGTGSARCTVVMTNLASLPSDCTQVTYGGNTGYSNNVNGTVAVSHGGTGATTATAYPGLRNLGLQIKKMSGFTADANGKTSLDLNGTRYQVLCVYGYTGSYSFQPFCNSGAWYAQVRDASGNIVKNVSVSGSSGSDYLCVLYLDYGSTP